MSWNKYTEYIPNKDTIIYNFDGTIYKEYKKGLNYFLIPSPKIWGRLKRQTFKERGNRCEICGSTKSLDIHHIKSMADFPTYMFDINNMKVLCVGCHKKQHSNINFFGR